MTSMSRGRHGTGTVSRKIFRPQESPPKLSFGIPRPGPSPRSQIFQFWVPVPNPGFSDFASRSDFRDQDCGIPGTLSRMLTPDFKSTCCRSGSMGSKAGLISCALGSFSIGGGTYSDICLKKIKEDLYDWQENSRYTLGCIKWDSTNWDKTNQSKRKTYA